MKLIYMSVKLSKDWNKNFIKKTTTNVQLDEDKEMEFLKYLLDKKWGYDTKLNRFIPIEEQQNFNVMKGGDTTEKQIKELLDNFISSKKMDNVDLYYKIIIMLKYILINKIKNCDIRNIKNIYEKSMVNNENTELEECITSLDI